MEIANLREQEVFAKLITCISGKTIMKLIVSFCPSITECAFHIAYDWTSELKGIAFSQ